MGFSDGMGNPFRSGEDGEPDPDWIRQREEHYMAQFGPMTEQVLHSTDLKAVHVDVYQFRPTND
jgi:hypothetical protein